MPKLNEYILSASIDALSKQNRDGSFLSGKNGPYGDKETSVRNTSHWICILHKAYKITNDKRFYNAIDKAISYLLSPLSRPMGYAMFCRKTPQKDLCNGLIGQAWAIEGLIAGGTCLGRDDVIQAAIDLFNMHPFDSSKAIWSRLSVDGTILSPDRTFNHQLWFGATGSLLPDEKANKKSKAFFDTVAVNPQTYNDGIIFHDSRMGSLLSRSTSPKELLKGSVNELKKFRRKSMLYKKSVGYHAFNLYAYSMFRLIDPANDFWSSNKWNSMLGVTTNSNFLRSLKDNCYGWHYNPPGIELAFVYELENKKDISLEWLERQNMIIRDTLDVDALTGSQFDMETAKARLYEACRLNNNYELKI